ncbi:TetR/AcrR family transcriptional regulator [Streptomyces aurantiogriseus]|uniref:TetR family transcriptional regulator n=1 Tax=Streptomyces aurantiogriseus TaxID=66870 RepID=A0A918BXQ6_9ACTN|nr:TetR/AcrR family transcriptional regulator [Streptomyces aurantiogriseus]GGQ95501.1 TetR family transcriptional regulator [Streptomyces aurantiogriseus]
MAKDTRPRRARSGRRPGDSGTREQILESALRLFADRGYARTTIRAIAEDAQVDPALVHHFFGNKEGVFDAAINSRFSVSSAFDTMATGEIDASMPEAAWLARTYLSFWEDEVSRQAMIAVHRAGLADSSTSQALRSRIEASTKAWAGRSGYKDRPESETRAALASGHLVGLAMMRYVLRIHPLAEMDFEEFLDWVVPALELRLSTAPEHRAKKADPGR